jgi:hypothetical protein
MLKSFGAILAGFLLVFILSIATDLIMVKVHVFPSPAEPYAYLPWMLVLALVYRSVYTVLGGYITALLAPDHPIRHVMILGLIGVVIAILGTIANWSKAIVSGTWYPITLIILTLPCL